MNFETNIVTKPRVITFDGYDPASATLRRGHMSGACLRSLVPPEYGTCYDDELAVRSGDFVVLTVRNREGATCRMVKQIRCTRDARWWAFCDDAPFQIGRTFRPLAIRKVVAFSTLDRCLPYVGSRAEADVLARLRAYAADALAEWERDGVRVGVMFPGLANVPTRPLDIAPAVVSQTVATPEYDEPVPANFMLITGLAKSVQVTWNAPAPLRSDQVWHLYQHTANTPFSSATRIWSGKARSTTVEIDYGVTRYFWVTGELNGQESAAYPVGNGNAGTPMPIETIEIENDAVAGVYAASGAGPVTVSLTAPSTSKIETVLAVTITTQESTDVVEVTASYRVGATGSGFTIKTAAMRELVGVGRTFVPTLEKDTTAYEPQAVVGTFTQSAGTYNFGLGVEIVGDGVNNASALFRNLNVRARVKKR